MEKKENADAFESINKNPILGIGLGNRYREIQDSSSVLLETYVHNGYLWILIKMGILGFLPFITFFLTFFYKSIKSIFDPKQSYLRSLYVGIILFIFGVMVINIVNPMFMQLISIVVIAISMGIGDVINRLENE